MTSLKPPGQIAGQRTVAIHHIERLGSDAVMLQLGIPDGTALSYEAGQFIAIHLPCGATRCYSMAHRQQAGAPLEFHIRLQPQGVFSQWLVDALNDAKVLGRTLSISGPYGDCTWRPLQSSADMTILLGGGTGIAPLTALLEEGLAQETRGPITLYWGGRQPNDFYCAAYFEALARRHQNFRFVPVVDTQDTRWKGRRGFVQDGAADDFPNLTKANVYACGSPIMVSSARQKLITQCGLDPDRFYADAFEPSVSIRDDARSSPRLRVQLQLADGSERIVQVAAGTSLMSALRAEGLMQGICGGQKSCGSCRIETDAAWSAHLPPPDRIETRLLAALSDPRPADRLACQIHLTPALDGLRIAIPDRPL